MEQKERNGGGVGHLVIERDQIGQLRVLFADQGACALTGLSREALLAAEPGQAIQGMETVRRELDSGHELWVLGACGRRQAAELAQANEALEDALKAAEAANQAKSQFLSNMSHDIRTPMNAIVGMTAIGLSHIDEKARVQDCLRKIKTASAHLMSLVNNVLDMSRIDSGRMTLNEEPFSLADLIHDIAVIVRPQAAAKGQSLQLEVGEICEENLIGDTLRLRQILVNIIGNAVKYTQPGGAVKARFSQRPAPERAGGGAVWLDFSCEDNGIGMSPAFLKRIFIPFERVASAAISKIEGTGLGMAIVKRLVDSMGGQIRVESEEGAGSRFYVELPIPVQPQGGREPALPVGQTVLVAESLDGRARQITDYLREGGLKPVCLTSGWRRGWML